ncbi:MAG: glycoside hydrolase family 1 protein [Patescibacteria group bacterium]|nr:glycoside hydrolase family 1 protein [Patescibacteria group bacterium]
MKQFLISMAEKFLFKFPEKFLWGASTSSHQVEGFNYNNWTEWEKNNAYKLSFNAKNYYQKWQQENFKEMFSPQNYVSGKSTDHYHKFELDFKLAKELGHNSTRFSIEWSRIEPEEGKFNQKEINHYKQVIELLEKLNLEPFVTIWHWTLPIWFESLGGFENSKNIFYFKRYVEKIVKNIGKNVKFWITINEPEIYSMMSYLEGKWPPQKKNIFKYLKVFHNLIFAHKETYKIIKKINPKAQIGIAKNNIYFESYKNKLANLILKKLADWWWNNYFLNKIQNYQDFIGLNHYFHNRINYGFNKNENKIVSDLGWEVLPESIYYVLKDLKKFNKPIYITENGLADAQDKKRIWFIFETLKNIYKALNEGVDIKGYFHWALIDNFEWSDGFWPRFGLIEINYENLNRNIRLSALFYKEICLNNGITYDMLEKYKNPINL